MGDKKFKRGAGILIFLLIISVLIGLLSHHPKFSSLTIKALEKIFRHVPYLNALSREEINLNLIRLKFFAPLSFDKTKVIENFFLKIFFLTFASGSVVLSMYFWFVNMPGSAGAGMPAIAFLMLNYFFVLTIYSKRIHSMSSEFIAYKENPESGVPEISRYLKLSWVAGALGFIFLMGSASAAEDLTIIYPDNLWVQYIVLITLINYSANLSMAEWCNVFIERDIFSPKFIWFFWIMMLAYLIFKNTDSLINFIF